MCGLVGAAGLLTEKHRKAFRRLLQLDTFRGPHSTGIFMARKTGEFPHLLFKELGTPWDFDQHNHEHFTRNVADTGAYLLLGHNRYATIGDITTENAHPFWEGDIVGAHNGTLKHTWKKDLHEGASFEVDSQCIFHTIDKIGINDTYPLIDGALALSWYNEREDTLNLIRNYDRPLNYVFTKDKKVMFWASEAWMLRNTLQSYEIAAEDVMTLNPHYHHVIDLHEGKSAPTILSANKLQHYTPPKFVMPKNKKKKKVYVSKTVPDYSVSELAVANSFVGKSVPFYIDKQSAVDKNVFYGHTMEDHLDVRLDLKLDVTAARYLAREMNNGVLLGEPKLIGYSDSSDIITVNMDPESITATIPWNDFPWDDDDYNTWVIENDLLSLSDAAYIMDDGEEPPQYIIAGEEVTKDHAEKLLLCGCGYCSFQEPIENFNNTRFLQDNTYLCNECTNSDTIVSMCHLR